MDIWPTTRAIPCLWNKSGVLSMTRKALRLLWFFLHNPSRIRWISRRTQMCSQIRTSPITRSTLTRDVFLSLSPLSNSEIWTSQISQAKRKRSLKRELERTTIANVIKNISNLKEFQVLLQFSSKRVEKFQEKRNWKWQKRRQKDVKKKWKQTWEKVTKITTHIRFLFKPKFQLCKKSWTILRRANFQAIMSRSKEEFLCSQSCSISKEPKGVQWANPVKLILEAPEWNRTRIRTRLRHSPINWGLTTAKAGVTVNQQGQVLLEAATMEVCPLVIRGTRKTKMELSSKRALTLEIRPALSKRPQVILWNKQSKLAIIIVFRLTWVNNPSLVNIIRQHLNKIIPLRQEMDFWMPQTKTVAVWISSKKWPILRVISIESDLQTVLWGKGLVLFVSSQKKWRVNSFRGGKSYGRGAQQPKTIPLSIRWICPVNK